MLPDWGPDTRERFLEQNKNFFTQKCMSDEIERSWKNFCALYPVVKDHQRSGLYLKSDASKTLWTVDWYAFEVKLSADGEYLVREGEWAGGIYAMAVSFYKKGNLIAEYIVDDLIDDDDSISHSVSHISWRRFTEFDKDEDQYVIRTVEDKQFTFDVKTGKMTDFKNTVSYRFPATIQYLNGGKQSVKDLSSCGLLINNGVFDRRTDNHSLLIIQAEPEKIQNSEIIIATREEKIAPLPFSLIKSAVWQEKSGRSNAIWRLQLQDNSILTTEISKTYGQFCAVTESDKKLSIDPLSIASIKFLKPIVPPQQRGIRSKEQRMRWDSENWEKSLAPFCQSVNLDEYKTVREKFNLARLLGNAKCNSVEYKTSLYHFDSWIRRQAAHKLIPAITLFIGDGMIKVGKKNDALALYRYILDKYPKPRLSDEFSSRSEYGVERIKWRINEIINANTFKRRPNLHSPLRTR